MPSQQIEVLVVGAGQAGVAMSEHLNGHGVPHLVLERHRIAERWRSERWDSLVANGPAWHDRFPGLEFAGLDPDRFAAKEQVADYFAAYAEKIGAPIRCGVEVTSVRKHAGRPGFLVETSDGIINARYVVAATGPFQRPVIPAVIPADAGLLNLHSSSYRNPRQLPDGAVLVVGAGSSGVQIAAELQQAGPPGLPLGRPARPAAATVPGARLRLVARRPRQVGGRHPAAGRGARHDRGQRRGRRPHGRLPRPRRQRHHPRRPDRRARQRHPAVRARPGREHRPRRRQLPVAAGRGRRLHRAQRPRPARGAGRAPPRPGPGLRHQPRPRARPRPGRGHRGRLGDRLHRRLRLARRRRVRPARPAEAPARGVVRARRLLPRPALAVAARVELHLGGLARRQVPGRPHPDAARLRRLRRTVEPR